MENTYKILLVGVEPSVFAGIVREWENQDGVCHIVKSVVEVTNTLSSEGFHLAAIAMFKEGVTALPSKVEMIQSHTDMPIVIIAMEPFEPELVRWISNAGVDYFDSASESAAQHLEICKALIRQHKSERGIRRENLTEISDGDLYFCLERRMVRIRDVEIQLTPKEFEILCILILSPQIVFSHDMLLQHIWSESGSIVTRKTICNHIIRLRNKLRIAPDISEYIISIRGVGFKYQHINLYQ